MSQATSMKAVPPAEETKQVMRGEPTTEQIRNRGMKFMFPGAMRLVTNCRTGCSQNVSFSRSSHDEFSWPLLQSPAGGALLLGVCENFLFSLGELLRRNRWGE
jgi:hypothetical protein